MTASTTSRIASAFDTARAENREQAFRVDVTRGRVAVASHVAEGGAPGQLLGLVDDLVAAVVALARVALGVLVGEDGAGGLHHRRRGEVLRGDQLHGAVLPLPLGVDDREQLGVTVGGPAHADAPLAVPAARAVMPGMRESR